MFFPQFMLFLIHFAFPLRLCVFAVRLSAVRFGSAGGNVVDTTKQGLEAQRNKARIIT